MRSVPNASALAMPVGAIVTAPGVTVVEPNASALVIPAGATSTAPGVTVVLPNACALAMPVGLTVCGPPNVEASVESLAAPLSVIADLNVAVLVDVSAADPDSVMLGLKVALEEFESLADALSTAATA